MIIDVTKELDACKSAECSTEQREHLRSLISKFYNEENVMLIYYGECYSQSRIEELVDAVLADNKNIENHNYIRLDANKIKSHQKSLAIILSFIVGVFVLVNQKNEYKDTDLYIMENSKTVRGQRGAGISSAITTYVFALVPYVGPFLGPAVGCTAGRWAGKTIGESLDTESKESIYAEYERIYNSLKNGGSLASEGGTLFANLKGDYSIKELRLIEKALSDGYFYEEDVPPYLYEKMRRNGNSLIFENKVRRKSRR